MALHQMHVDLRRVLELEHRVVVKVALHDLTILHVDLAFQRGGQPIKSGSLQLLPGNPLVGNKGRKREQQEGKRQQELAVDMSQRASWDEA